MKLTDVPFGSTFLDVDSIPVVKLPSGECVAFDQNGDSRPYPNVRKADLEGDKLTQDEFREWIATGRNVFDAEPLSPEQQSPAVLASRAHVAAVLSDNGLALEVARRNLAQAMESLHLAERALEESRSAATMARGAIDARSSKGSLQVAEESAKARQAYYEAFGSLGPRPFEVPDEVVAKALLAAVKSGRPIPDDYDWYPDLPPGAVV